MLTNIHLLIKSFVQKIGRDKVYNYSASSAFFIILSIFPFLILMLSVVKYTPLTEEFLLERLEFFLPSALFPLFAQIIEEIYSNTWATTLILVSAVTVLWSSSKGVMAMVRGINVCFNIQDKRNWIRVRLLSCLYTFVFFISIVLTLILLVFGKTIYTALITQSGQLEKIFGVILFILRKRVVISLGLLTLIFMLIYTFFPAKNNHFFKMFPGAILAAGGWVGLSELLSLYVKFFPNFSYTYGSLTTFVLLMLYLYFGLYIIFIGAEINHFFKSWLESIANRRKRAKSIKYEDSIERKQVKYETKKMKKEEKEELRRMVAEAEKATKRHNEHR